MKFTKENFNIPLRFLTGSFYYQWAESFYRAADEFTQTEAFSDFPFLQVKLTENYLKFFASTFGMIFFMADLYASKWIGISYAMLSSISQCLTSNVDNLEDIPVLREGMNLGLYLGINLFLEGLSLFNLAFFAVSYVLGLTCRFLVGYIFDRLMDDGTTSHRHANAFTKAMIQHGGFIGGTVFMRYFSGLYSSFAIPTDAALLNDSDLCLDHAEACRRAALDKLKLPQNATWHDIKRQWRRAALQHHPDKNFGRISEQFSILRQAHARLKDLQRRFFSSRPDFGVEICETNDVKLLPSRGY